MTELDTASILGRSGRIARRLSQYEERPEQLQMAEAVQQAIRDGSHLVVEAGTGVGKSFAYLVPAILAAAARKAPPGEKRPIIVSTHTISLQEQLIARDIPFLNAVLPVEFSAVLVKGRSNYISLRRMRGALDRAHAVFSQPEELEHLERIVEWSKQTTDGSLADLEFRPLPRVWDETESDHGNCLGRKCPSYDACFYYKARRRVWNADLLVVNHALYFSDLALRREGASILPEHDVVILDEAHTLEAVAGEHLGVTVSSGQIDYLLAKLYNDRTQRGLLVHHGLHACQQLVAELRFQARDFFFELREWQRSSGGPNGRLRQVAPVRNSVSPPLRKLAASISAEAEAIAKDEERIELASASDRCLALAAALDTWLEQTIEKAVYWTEEVGKRGQNAKLVCAPIEVGPVLRDELFNRVSTAVLTSATLAVGSQGFDFLKSRLGLTETRTLQLGSPFDYKTQARLVLPAGMPDPASQPREYDEAVCASLKKYVAQTGGRAFVLFTSYKMMQSCADRLMGWFAQQNLTLYCQGESLPRSLMLERFRSNPRSVLFGTDSFWQGVDVPGDALQNVIIAKLPFSVPDQPLLEARVEAIQARGGNPIFEYQLPEAVIKLKQGFGRLIRRKTDTGQVVILDPRVRTKRYGRLFLESLPECERVLDRD